MSSSPIDPTVLLAAGRLQNEVLAALKQSFVGKDEVIDLLGIALVSGENLFLLGPPGTAKTALIHELSRRLEARSFDYLLTRFTEPNELFGPFDIRRLRDGDLVTNTEGMLPEADLIFLDELLNANSAILNSLLMVLNERTFRRGRETRAIPALLVAGASNHLPEDESLRALFDRFPLRVRCGPVPDAELLSVLEAGWQLDAAAVSAGTPAAPMSAADVRLMQSAVRQVDLTGVRVVFAQLIVQLRKAGIAVSDRRAVRLQRVVAASALLSGRSHAVPGDLWVFSYLWDREEQIELNRTLVQHVTGQTAAGDNDHPRAQWSRPPDPEALSRALTALSERLQHSRQTSSTSSPATLTPDAAAKATSAGDELRLLASRIEWVENEESRSALRERAEALWPLIAGSPELAATSSSAFQ